MNSKEFIQICESFTAKAKSATKKLDLLTIAFAAHAFYKYDWKHPLYDSGNWMAELELRIKCIEGSKGSIISKSGDLKSFQADLRDALSSLCRNFTYNLRDNLKS